MTAGSETEIEGGATMTEMIAEGMIAEGMTDAMTGEEMTAAETTAAETMIGTGLAVTTIDAALALNPGTADAAPHPAPEIDPEIDPRSEAIDPNTRATTGSNSQPPKSCSR